MRRNYSKIRSSEDEFAHTKPGMIFTENGFTLIELMISIAIFSIVIAGIVTAFHEQLKSHNTQQQILSMQQNARAAMYYMTRELKNAGLDPTGSATDATSTAAAGITNAQANTITFAMDFTGGTAGNGVDDDGDTIIDEADEPFWDGTLNGPNEIITYALSNDADNNGICDNLPGLSAATNGFPCALTRAVGVAGAPQILADNVDALDFIYLDEDGNRMVNPMTALPDIRSVQITLVARAGQNVTVLSYKVTDNNTYYNQQGDIILPVTGDQFRRIFLSTEIKCRNLGLS